MERSVGVTSSAVGDDSLMGVILCKVCGSVIEWFEADSEKVNTHYGVCGNEACKQNQKIGSGNHEC